MVSVIHSQNTLTCYRFKYVFCLHELYLIGLYIMFNFYSSYLKILYFRSATPIQKKVQQDSQYAWSYASWTMCVLSQDIYPCMINNL